MCIRDSTYGYDNTNTVDDSLVQPRFGFNYTFDRDRPTQLRGGVGLFGGCLLYTSRCV